MQNIDQHIIELILSYQTVIIPKLGCFTKHSTFDLSKNHEFSRTETLLFSQNPKLDDGMLYKYVALQENISFSDAQIKVDSFISQLKITVFNQKQFPINPLGFFHLNLNEEITFQYASKFQLFPEFHGLIPFSKQPIIRKVEINNIPKHKSKAYYWATACLVPVLGAFIYLGVNNRQVLNDNATATTAGLSEINITENSTPYINLDKLEHVDFSFLDETEIEEPLFFPVKSQNKTKPVVNKKAVNKKAYQIIIGVFGNKTNAVKLANSIKSMSKEIAISPYKGMHKVSSDVYTSKYKATKDLETIRKSHPNAWLLKVK